jgi:hypothetical protein
MIFWMFDYPFDLNHLDIKCALDTGDQPFFKLAKFRQKVKSKFENSKMNWFWKFWVARSQENFN